MESNYEKYRGKCKELCEELIKKNKKLKIVRGFYHEPLWGTREQHFWCVDENGEIHDPSKYQFPSGGIKEFYEEFDGTIECEECGKIIDEKNMILQGRFPVCSKACALRLVGLEMYL